MFDPLACCAMRNLESDFQEICSGYEKKIGSAGTDLFLGIFKNTEKIHFIPNPIQKEFFLEVLGKEIEFLSNIALHLLPCGHYSSMHRDALQKVHKKLEYVKQQAI